MGLLRLLLALSVVAVHCGSILHMKFVGGQIAVQSFYIISGFYMSLILNEKYVGGGVKSYRLFITNRLLRLYPIYWLILIATVVYCLVTGYNNNWQVIPKFEFYASVKFNLKTLTFLIFANLFIIGQALVMFLGISPETGGLYFTTNFMNSNPQLYNFLFIGQAWTLELEILFYLIAPFIVRRKLKTIIALILLSIICRFVIYDYIGLKNDPWTYRFFPTEIAFFLTGCLSYQIYTRIKTIAIKRTISLSIFAFVIGLTLVYPFLPGIKVGFMPFSLKELFYFFVVMCTIPFLFTYFKNSKLDTRLGELSYPVYISHLFVMLVIERTYGSITNAGWLIAVLTISLSYILNVIVSNPIERYRQKRVAKFSMI